MICECSGMFNRKGKKYDYNTRGTLNKGSKVEAKGSGCQLFAARKIFI
jgi:hypothetical protein